MKPEASALLQRVFGLPIYQSVKLTALLGMDEIRSSVPIDELLQAVGRRQAAKTFQHSELVVMLFQRWPTEPRVVEFFREALRERGPEAVFDLSMTAQPPWDDSLLEPIVSLVERTSLEKTTKPWDQRLTLDRALAYLDRTYTKWSHDPAIAPRLSAAVLQFSPAPSAGAMYGWADMLSLTHDRAMIKILRPYLDDKTLDNFTSNSSNMPSGATPMRYSELAANAICRLLGEPILFSPWDRAKAPKGWTVPGVGYMG